MRKAVLIALLALVAGASQAGWESWLKSGLYHASFEMYEQGQELSDIGASKGTWTNGTWSVPVVPSDAEAVAASNPGPGQYIRFSTEENGLVFTPYTTGERYLKTVLVSACLQGCEEPPDLPNTARGAFSIFVPEGADAQFMGWTTNGWQALQDVSAENPITPVSGDWYDVLINFLQKDDAVLVQYLLKRKGDLDYVTLHAVDDVKKVWFPSGGEASGPLVSKLEFRGDGAFRYLEGSEPRRGLLVSLVPWREILIDESVYDSGTGDWYAFDYNSKKWLPTPIVAKNAPAYVINVPDGENYTGFHPQKQPVDNVAVVEFAVRFLASNDNDAAPSDEVCALVRIVEDPVPVVTDTDLTYRFACMGGGRWYTNTTIKACLDSDYTVEVRLDGSKDPQTVSYRVKKGRGAEGGDYVDLVKNAPVVIGSPLFTFFGGLGQVYSIKSSSQSSR